jgi:hypothetical protein
MANFELYLKDFFPSQKAQILMENFKGKQVISITFYDLNGKFLHPFVMEKSTAIKFAKTLRTEINKITESEVNNV